METVIKRVDELGRLVIPVQYRDELGINDNDSVVIKLIGKDLVISKYKNTLNMEKCIREFIISTYGSKYSDILVTNKMKCDVYTLLQGYFDTQIK